MHFNILFVFLFVDEHFKLFLPFGYCENDGNCENDGMNLTI